MIIFALFFQKKLAVGGAVQQKRTEIFFEQIRLICIGIYMETIRSNMGSIEISRIACVEKNVCRTQFHLCKLSF